MVLISCCNNIYYVYYSVIFSVPFKTEKKGESLILKGRRELLYYFSVYNQLFLVLNVVVQWLGVPIVMAERMGTSVYKSTYKSVYKDKRKDGEVNVANFITQAAILKTQQDYLDKAQAIAIRNARCLEHHAAQDLTALHKEMEYQRFQDNERLRHSLSSVLQTLKQLKGDVRNEDKLMQLEIEHYQKSVLELERKIRIFNEASDKRFQKLLEEECDLSNELNSLESKYDDWSQPVNASLLKPPVRSVSKSYISNSDNTREEVLSFQRFLQDTGGHTGGWDEEDHLLFLRLRDKHKGKIAFLSLLKQHLPDISADEMLLHEDWYHQYETLKSKQKRAIQDWRTSKDKNSQQNGKNPELVELHQRSKVEYHEDAEEKKQRIEEWKKTLQLKKELEDKKQWEIKEKELEREQNRRQKQELKKAEVERYKEEKLNEQQTKMLFKQLKELREMEERAVEANILRKAFRQQDQLFVARRLYQREQQTIKEEQKKIQLQTLKQETNVDRDPKRLLRPTAAWREYCKPKPKTSTVNNAMTVLHLRNMPHLQVPSWRRGLI